jgi:hypothetical protein
MEAAIRQFPALLNAINEIATDMVDNKAGILYPL